MALCISNSCCLPDTNEIDMRVKSGSDVPGVKTGVLPEPDDQPNQLLTSADVKASQGASEQEIPVAITPASEKKDDSDVPADQVGAVFVVEIEKTTEMKKVGLDIFPVGDETLEVKLVKDGLVQVYNEGAIANRKIRQGDHIIEVNGCTGDNRKMLETVGREAKLRFVIKPCRRD